MTGDMYRRIVYFISIVLIAVPAGTAVAQADAGGPIANGSFDLVNPAGAGGTPDDVDDVFLWSLGDAATSGLDLDEDPSDQEIRIGPDPSTEQDQNLWQNLLEPGREPAYTANFDALEFDVESGSIADNASVVITLGGEPLNAQEPFAVVFYDCSLTFPGSYLQDSLGQGTVSASPVGDGVGYDGQDDPHCPDKLSREALGRLSIAQVTFRDFNDGTEPIVIDNVALPGASTHAEEAANMNFRVCANAGTGPLDETTCEDAGDGPG